MKLIPVILSGLILLAACNQGSNQGEEQAEQTNEKDNDSLKVTLTQVWETDTSQLITPECATYDPDKHVFYISNLNRDNDTENDGYLSIVNEDGSIVNAQWVKGLASPLGSAIYSDHLYVNDKEHIVKISIESGEIIEKFKVEGAGMLNGMDIDDDGNIYSADSEKNRIFKVTQKGEASVLFESDELNRPNGLLIENDELIIASSAGSKLFSLNFESKELKAMVENIGGADGIIQLEGGHYLTSSWSGEVYFITKNMTKQKLLDTREDEINAADIGYIPNENILVVPTFYDNRLVAYKLGID